MTVVMERLREFDHMAGLLNMPYSERLSILNISEALYDSLRSGASEYIGGVRPEFARRLSYALPLMRRLASTTPCLGMYGMGYRAA